jgi:hypothetical protein
MKDRRWLAPVVICAAGMLVQGSAEAGCFGLFGGHTHRATSTQTYSACAPAYGACGQVVGACAQEVTVKTVVKVKHRLFRGLFGSCGSGAGACAPDACAPSCQYAAPTPQATPAPPSKQMPAPPPKVTPQAQHALGAINSFRARFGLPALAWDANLASWAMANCNACSRSGLGHHVMAGASQIAAGTGSVDGAISAWYASPAHRAILLSPRVRVVGFASDGRYATANIR